MAKISDLPIYDDLGGSELVPIVKDGVTRRAALGALAAAPLVLSGTGASFLALGAFGSVHNDVGTDGLRTVYRPKAAEGWGEGVPLNGDPGTVPMLVGLLADLHALDVPVGTDRIQTSGWDIVGIGAAAYALADAAHMDSAWEGVTWATSANDRTFLLDVEEPTLQQLGGDPTGGVEIGPALQAMYAWGRGRITGGTFKVVKASSIPIGTAPKITGDRTGILKMAKTSGASMTGSAIRHLGDPANLTDGIELSGFVIDGYDNGYPVDRTVHRDTVLTCLYSAVQISNAKNCRANSLLIQGTTYFGMIYGQAGDNNEFAHNELIDAAYNAKPLAAYSKPSAAFSQKNVRIHNNIIRRCGPTLFKDASYVTSIGSTDGIHVDDAAGAHIYLNEIYDVAGIGIRIETSTDFECWGNIVDNCGQDGIAAYLSTARGTIYGNRITRWGRIPLASAFVTYGGQTYVMRETPNISTAPLPADPSASAMFELAPYSLDGITNIPAYNASDYAKLPFRGYSAVTVNNSSSSVYVHDNAFIGDLSLDSSGRYKYASDFGEGYYQYWNVPTTGGQDIRYENNAAKNVRLAVSQWRPYMDPTGSRGPAPVPPFGTNAAGSWRRNRDGTQEVWGVSFVTKTAQDVGETQSGSFTMPVEFADTYLVTVSANDATAAADVVSARGRRLSRGAFAWSSKLVAGGTSQTYKLDYRALGRWRVDPPLGAIANATYAFSGWATQTNVTLTANAAVAPNGKREATKLAATAAASTTFRASANATGGANGNEYTIYVKRGSGDQDANRFTLRNATTATDLVTLRVDHAALTIISGTGGAIDPITDGWYRLTLTATSGISAGDNLLLYAGFAGAGETAGEYCYVWGADLAAL